MEGEETAADLPGERGQLALSALAAAEVTGVINLITPFAPRPAAL